MVAYITTLQPKLVGSMHGIATAYILYSKSTNICVKPIATLFTQN